MYRQSQQLSLQSNVFTVAVLFFASAMLVSMQILPTVFQSLSEALLTLESFKSDADVDGVSAPQARWKRLLDIVRPTPGTILFPIRRSVLLFPS